MVRLQARQTNGYTSNPFPRLATAGWDWHCYCGRLNYCGRPKCFGCPGVRKDGATLVGSLRGVPQATPVARLAVAAQDRVPKSQPLQPTTRVQQPPAATLAATTTAQRAAATTAPTKRILHKTSAAAAATAVARDPAAAGGGYASALIANTKSSTSVPAATPKENISGEAQSASATIQTDKQAQMQADAPEELDIDPDPTIPEDLGYDEIRKKLLRCETALRKKQKRHERELNEVREMEQYIEEKRTQLAVLQDKADATGSDIQEFAATIAALSARSTELAAERSKALEAKSDPLSSQQHQQPTKAGTQYARQVVADLIAGMHNFTNETPEVQLILQQFVAYLDQLRPQSGASATAMQQSPTAVVAPAPVPMASVAMPTVPPAIVTTPTCFDISDTKQTVVPMVVVGQSVGDKRKREHLLDAERPSAAQSDEDITGDEASVTPTGAPPQAAVARPVGVGTEAVASTPAATADTPFVFGSGPCKLCWSIVCRCIKPAVPPKEPQAVMPTSKAPPEPTAPARLPRSRRSSRSRTHSEAGSSTQDLDETTFTEVQRGRFRTGANPARERLLQGLAAANAAQKTASPSPSR